MSRLGLLLELDLATANSRVSPAILRALIIFALVLWLPSHMWAGQFNLPPQFTAGFDPFSAAGGPARMAAGDFNHDGKWDVAVIHGVGFGSVVTVMLGNGDGTFQPGLDYQTAFGPQSVAVADFNGDGNEDLAVSCAGVFFDGSDGSISVLLGNGDGTFAPRVDYAPGGQPYAIAAGDFNGDGAIDIVFSYGSAATVSVLLNNGDGTFRSQLDSTDVGGVLAVGDLNHDGKLDVVVSENFELGVLLGNGDGTFQPTVSYAVPPLPQSATIVDFNGDGFLDLAALCVKAADEKTVISVLLGNGDGTFKDHVDYAVGYGGFFENVAAADINGDGHLDLMAAKSYGNTVSILLGNGDGTFQATMSYIAPGAVPLVAADFNGDDRPDVAVGDYNGNAISVLLNSGGRFPTAGFYATGHAPGAVAIADVNGDGKKDLVVANGGPYFLEDYPDNTISVLFGNGDGTFQSHVDYQSGVAPLAVAVADLNGDGKADIVSVNANDNTVSVFLNRGDGTFRPKVDYSTSNYPRSIVIGDFNGDGKPDIAVAALGNSVVSVLLGNADGTFRPKVDYGTALGLVSIAVADFNDDGKLDLATSNCDCGPGLPEHGTVSILLGNGDGTFAAHVDYDMAGTVWGLAIGDLNGDQNDDIVTSDGFSGSGIGVLLGRGDGTFHSVVKYPGGTGSGATVADFNGDGKLDVAVANGNFADNSVAYGATVSVFWGNGDGSLRPPVDFGVGSGSYALASGDLNGDHKPDLAVVAMRSSGVSILLNTATVPQYVLTVTPPPGGGSVQSSPAGINACGFGSACNAAFDSGTIVTLTTPGSVSTNWSGNCSGIGSCALNMTADRSVTATLSQNPTMFTLTVKKVGNGVGTVEDLSKYINCGSYCSSNFPSGSSIPIGAAPIPGNTFAGWSGDGCSSTFDCYVTMSSDITLTATFTLPKGFHQLTVTGSGSGGGTITSSPSGINCTVDIVNGNRGACEAGFAGGTITLSFTPYQGYILTGWGGAGCAGTGACVLNFNGDLTVTANIDQAPPPPDFSMSASTLTPTAVSSGGTATSSITVDAQGGFSGSVSLICSASPTPQFAPQCSMSPSSVSPGTPSTLTVTTTAPTSSASLSGFSNFPYAIWLPMFGLMLLGAGLAPTRAKKSKMLGVLVYGLVLTVVAFQAGCGGSGNGGQHNSGGTPPGSYIITITGTSGSLQHSTTVTLTVQ